MVPKDREEVEDIKVNEVKKVSEVLPVHGGCQGSRAELVRGVLGVSGDMTAHKVCRGREERRGLVYTT